MRTRTRLRSSGGKPAERLDDATRECGDERRLVVPGTGDDDVGRRVAERRLAPRRSPAA